MEVQAPTAFVGVLIVGGRGHCSVYDGNSGNDLSQHSLSRLCKNIHLQMIDLTQIRDL